MIDTLISGGQVVTSDRVSAADVAVDDGCILAVGDGDSFPEPRRHIDASGCLVMPGVVDPHVHVNGPSSVDSYDTGSAAAALGGVTTFCTFAWQTRDDRPETNSIPGAIEYQREAARESRVDVGLHAVVTDESLAESTAAAAVDAGVPSFKLFTAYEFGVSNVGLERAFEVVGDLDGVALVHTEDRDVCERRTAELRESEATAPESYPASRPPHSEAMAADSAIRLALAADCKYYGMHTSGRESAAAIDSHVDDGSRVRAETCVHYTTLDASTYERLGGAALMAPPLRGPAAADALFEHLDRGPLRVVSTDHVALTRAEKADVDWWDAGFGVNSLQWSLPVFYDEAVVRRGHSPVDLVRFMCSNPARTFGFDRKGTLTPGTDADVVVFDPDATQTIDETDNASKSDYSVYNGREVRGRVERTLVRGEVVAADGELQTEQGHGTFVERSPPAWE